MANISSLTCTSKTCLNKTFLSIHLGLWKYLCSISAHYAEPCLEVNNSLLEHISLLNPSTLTVPVKMFSEKRLILKTTCHLVVVIGKFM